MQNTANCLCLLRLSILAIYSIAFIRSNPLIVLLTPPVASDVTHLSPVTLKNAGIYDGDRVIIDRAVEPHDGSIVIAWVGGEGFTMKYLDLTHRKDGYIELRPANPDYPVFKIDNPDNFEVWGVVVHLIRTFEKI